jgi:hypothetical protein
VQTVAYYYTVKEADKPCREIFGYHWHPVGRSPITYPHFHVYDGAELGREMVRKAHFPTGRIALESILRLVIKEFGVIPLRSDREDILDRMEGTYER